MTKPRLVLTLLAAIAAAPVANAQTVKGPGSAEIANVVVVCRWHTNPACYSFVTVVNTSDKFGVTQVTFDGLDPFVYWIPPLGRHDFEVPNVPSVTAMSKEELISTAVIHTAKKPRP